MKTNNPILSDYSTVEQINKENDLTSIEVERGIGSYFPIFVSLGITLYGFYLFLQAIVDSSIVIYSTLAFLGILLVYIEHHRAGLIADWLGSKLENLVNKSVSIPNVGLAVGMAITVLFIALDTWGAMQSADSIERMLIDGIVKNSEQYKLENSKAKSGVNEAKAYQEQLREWRTAKNAHHVSCDEAWRLPSYRTKNTKCKDKFVEAQPTKIAGGSGSIDIGTYNSMEDKAKQDVAGYRKMFFWVFLGFSILLNYFAMASLFNQHRAKRKELTPEVIDELTDRMELMNAEKLNKLSLSTKAQEQKLKEKNIIDVELEKETYNIVLAKKLKALTRKRQIPLQIASGQSVSNVEVIDDEEPGTKAAFYDTKIDPALMSIFHDINAKAFNGDLPNTPVYVSNISETHGMLGLAHLNGLKSSITLDESLSASEQKEVLAHEMVHLFLQHEKHNQEFKNKVEQVSKKLNITVPVVPTDFKKTSNVPIKLDEQKYLYEMFKKGTARSGTQLKARNVMDYFSSNSYGKREQLNKFINKLVKEKVIFVTENGTFSLMDYADARRKVGVISQLRSSK